MIIQLNSDKNIQISERLDKFVSEKISSSLKRFAGKITRIEVHLSDQSAQKTGPDDILCKIEARVKDLQPVIVTGKGDSKEHALGDALVKIKAALDSATGKIIAKKNKLKARS
ncbi:MAG: HPF/RaiA family ribosome-associated protein [Bacteroidales bacterium]|jgi:ribosomal subunit interface protein|nr:HPF/RaiA family ribosome-associated protein [Bacteroidales bacterium]